MYVCMYVYIYIYIYICTFAYRSKFQRCNLADIKNCLPYVVNFESLKSILRRQNACH